LPPPIQRCQENTFAKEAYKTRALWKDSQKTLVQKKSSHLVSLLIICTIHASRRRVRISFAREAYKTRAFSKDSQKTLVQKKFSHLVSLLIISTMPPGAECRSLLQKRPTKQGLFGKTARKLSSRRSLAI